MKASPITLEQVRFRYLKVEQVADPIAYINNFCEQEATLDYFRQGVLDLLKTAYSHSEKFYSGASPSYAYYQQQLIRLIEISYVLTLRGDSFSFAEDTTLKNDYRCLDPLERRDVSVFLDYFFEYKNLDEWCEYLDDILIHAYKEGGAGYFDYDERPFKNIEMMEKLAEAVFLIYEVTTTGLVCPLVG